MIIQKLVSQQVETFEEWIGQGGRMIYAVTLSHRVPNYGAKGNDNEKYA